MAGIPRPAGSCGADTTSRSPGEPDADLAGEQPTPGREEVATWRSGSYLLPAQPRLLGHRQCGALTDPRPREGTDSLFTSSATAIQPKTGAIVCYYQCKDSPVSVGYVQVARRATRLQRGQSKHWR